MPTCRHGRAAMTGGPGGCGVRSGRIVYPPDSVSKKSFRHAVRIFKLSKKFKNTCRLNAKGAFCPLHTSPAALSQTFSARFFDSLTGGGDPRPDREHPHRKQPPRGSGILWERTTKYRSRKKPEKIRKKVLTKGENAGIICKHSSRGQQIKAAGRKSQEKSA